MLVFFISKVSATSLFIGKILQVVNGHFDVVTCITRSECNLNQDCYIVTGSKDCTAMVWMFTSRNQAIIGDNGSKWIYNILWNFWFINCFSSGVWDMKSVCRLIFIHLHNVKCMNNGYLLNTNFLEF